MTTLSHFEVRRRLLNMNGLQVEQFGRLTVCVHYNLNSTRWQIDSIGVRQSFSYKVYPDLDYVFGTIDQIGERNEALRQAVDYIMANYQSERLITPDRCPVCDKPLPSIRATYCGVNCKERAYRQRKASA